MLVILPLVECLKNIVWSNWHCEYPELRMEFKNLSNYALGDCLKPYKDILSLHTFSLP